MRFSRAHRRENKISRRGRAMFSANFASRVPGIRFEAEIECHLEGEIGEGSDHAQTSISARLALRSILSDVLRDCCPFDVAAAEDKCNRILGVPRGFGKGTPTCAGRVSLSLRSLDQEAVRDLQKVILSQSFSDQSEVIRLASLRDRFTDPTILLAWLFERHGGESGKLPKFDGLKEAAQFSRRLRRSVGAESSSTSSSTYCGHSWQISRTLARS